MLQVKDFSIDNKGLTDVSLDIQRLLDMDNHVVINKGIYKISNIFLNDNQTLEFKDAVIIANTSEDNYLIKDTRVAGIDMPWYLGLINAIDKKNVKIIGNGVINGNGEYWWNKYWGSDYKSGMRGIYDSLGLRAFCDYDCKRIRSVLIQNCNNVLIEGIELIDSGFWNIHILYSLDVVINNVKINVSKISPSTDGIDVDSSSNVLIQNCEIECNDDSIAIKSGRDSSGILKNISCHDVVIKDCIIKKGYGITIGSELSGGIENIRIENIKYYNTDCGFRIKSSILRKGYVKDIFLNNLEFNNVTYGINIQLNWNPNYSICKIPDNLENVPEYYKILSDTSFINLKNTVISNLNFKNVVGNVNRLFNVIGFVDSPILDINISDSVINCLDYGILKNVLKLNLENVKIIDKFIKDDSLNDFDNR